MSDYASVEAVVCKPDRTSFRKSLDVGRIVSPEAASFFDIGRDSLAFGIETMSCNLIGIDDPNTVIYRIYPLWFFEQALELRQLVLVRPQAWEDPFEIVAELACLVDERDIGKRAQLGTFLSPAYAQCWSKTGNSDTLWRAYSRIAKDPLFNRNTVPREEGVRVRSTAGRLLAAVVESRPDFEVFVGAVKYVPDREVLQFLANLVDRNGPRAVGCGELRALLMLLKREMYAHEDEVRLICVDERGYNSAAPEYLTVTIDPSDVFAEVTFDPRLSSGDRQRRQDRVENLGYPGPFLEPTHYSMTTVPEIVLPNGWEDEP